MLIRNKQCHWGTYWDEHWAPSAWSDFICAIDLFCGGRGESREGEKKAQLPCMSAAPCNPQQEAFLGFSQLNYQEVWASWHQLCDSLDDQKGLTLNANSDLLVPGCSMVEQDSGPDPRPLSKTWLDQLAMSASEGGKGNMCTETQPLYLGFCIWLLPQSLPQMFSK